MFLWEKSHCAGDSLVAQQHTSLLIQGLYVLVMSPLWVPWALCCDGQLLWMCQGRLAVIPVSCQAPAACSGHGPLWTRSDPSVVGHMAQGGVGEWPRAVPIH